MRTTLKRGIGRHAANGNGHGVLPPGALSPVTLYRQSPPPRRSFAAQVGRALGTVRSRRYPLGMAIRGYFRSPRHDEPWIGTDQHGQSAMKTSRRRANGERPKRSRAL